MKNSILCSHFGLTYLFSCCLLPIQFQHLGLQLLLKSALQARKPLIRSLRTTVNVLEKSLII